LADPEGIFARRSLLGVMGASATSVFDLTADPFGSHMHDSHHNATEQVGLGMLGPLIVVPKDRTVEPSFDKDELFILNDALGGLTINGKGFPATAPYTAKVGAWAFHCHILGQAEGQTGMFGMFGMVTALIVAA
jgi:FtsP/CotA-like multicopper oxidase with cupredoxin domain